MNKYIFFFLLLISFRSAAQTDCLDAVVVCGNTSFENLELNGFGNQEISSCGSEEHNSLWIKIHIQTSGTLSFDIVPESSDIDEDFDFFLYSYISCDDITEVRCSTTNPVSAGLSSNVTGTNNSETDEFEGPDLNGDSFVKNVDVVAGETYMLVIDRPFGNSNFSVQWNGTATFNDPPQIAPLPPGITTLDIFQCDADGVPDDSTAFNLTQNTPLIKGSQTGVSVAFYTSQSDSLLGINELSAPNAFVNTSNPQTIYVRVENDLTECSATSEFQIGVNNEIALAANEFAICDDAADGNASNGKAAFNMQSVSAFVFPAFASPGNTVQYFLSQQNAEDGVNPIAATFYNTTAGSQTVFIKIDNGLCHTIQPVDLIVRFFNSVPAAQLVQCDYGANPDGISVFNLSEADVLFTGSDPAFVVQYFENAAALAANSPLSPTYTNLTNPQNVVVKITDGVTGCSSSNTLTLKVNTVTAQSITGLAKCSDNGFVQFDLTDANVVISPQETAAYYPSLNDALLQMNQIANVSSYTNPVAFHSSVFVRIDDSVNGCSGISEITLDINPLPAIDLTDEAYICANQPGAEVQIDAGLLPSGQGFTFIWKFATMLLPDTTYSISATQVGTYTVDITSAIGCTNTRAILVQPADVATIQSITADGNSPNANSVTINLTPSSVGNFGYSIDQPNGPFQVGNYFPAISCGRHIAYVDGGNGCGASSFAFEIMGIPSYFSPNNDGFADRWNITCGENHPATTLYIFDRFGKLIKEIGAAGLGWDGTLNGQPMPSDDYWYILNSDDGKTSKGHFALKR